MIFVVALAFFYFYSAGKLRETRMKNYSGITKEDVLNAISGSKTIISTIAKKLNCSWDTANKYINKWEETKQAYENERQKVVDVAESKLFTNIQKGDMGAIKYFLSKKAKDRGYSDLLDGSDGQLKVDNTLHIVIDD